MLEDILLNRETSTETCIIIDIAAIDVSEI